MVSKVELALVAVGCVALFIGYCVGIFVGSGAVSVRRMPFDPYRTLPGEKLSKRLAKECKP